MEEITCKHTCTGRSTGAIISRTGWRTSIVITCTRRGWTVKTRTGRRWTIIPEIYKQYHWKFYNKYFYQSYFNLFIGSSEVLSCSSLYRSNSWSHLFWIKCSNWNVLQVIWGSSLALFFKVLTMKRKTLFFHGI